MACKLAVLRKDSGNKKVGDCVAAYDIDKYLGKVKKVMKKGGKFCFYVSHHFLDVAPNAIELENKEALKNLSPQVKKSLRYSVYDGVFYFLMVGIGESFFVPFALFFQAGIIQVGLLGSLPLVFGSIMQLGSQRISKVIQSRKKLVWLGAFIQGLVFLPIASLLWLPFNPVNIFIGLACSLKGTNNCFTRPQSIKAPCFVTSLQRR